MEANSKRRRFIQATLVAPLAASLSGRLHGAPASVDLHSGASGGADKLVLPLANAGLPSTTLVDLASVTSLIETVLIDPLEAEAFVSSPRSYFRSHGLDDSDSTLLDSSVVMLIALSQPEVKSALANRDYHLFFDYMRAAGVFEARDPSFLQSRVEGLITSNIDEIREAIKANSKLPLTAKQQNEFMSILRTSGVAATEEDLAVVTQILRSDSGVTIAACSAMAACVVGIALLAAIYVSVGVAVTVAILAGVGVSAAVKTAVFVNGQRPRLASAPFTGQFAKLDPIAVRNIQKSYRLAQVTGDGRLQLYALREAIREEVSAVLMSLSKLDLITVAPDRMPLVVEAVANYAYKSAGVPTPHAH